MHQCRIKKQLHIIFISNNLHYFSKICRYVDEFVYICRCRAIYTVHASAITNKFALLSASAYICLKAFILQRTGRFHVYLPSRVIRTFPMQFIRTEQPMP